MNEKKAWRFLDTGALSAAENMAIDAMLLELCAQDKIPNTIRVLQFYPPAVLVGFHQSIEQEVRMDYCRQMGIEINRRITGGGTVFFDRTQLGWEVIARKEFFNHHPPNTDLFKKLSQPIIQLLQSLGINARFRGRNDIEVNGRKISGTGGAEEGKAFLFQGTLLVDFDVETMLRVLRVPIEKLKKHEIDSLKERVTCIKWELGYTPDLKMLKTLIRECFATHFRIDLIESDLTEMEKKLLPEYLKKFRSEKWLYKVRMPVFEQPVIYTTQLSKGGKIKAFFITNLRRRRLQSLILMGDFFAYPSRALFDLESIFKDMPLERELMIRELKDYFQNNPDIYLPQVTLTDFLKIIDSFFEKLKMIEIGFTPEQSNHIFLVNGTYEEIINQRPRYLLLPYCAKSPTCVYRYQNFCTVCEGCSVGVAYQLSHEHDLYPITITSFEDLVRKLKKLKSTTRPAYIGCCCEQFYIKHQKTFEQTKIPAILLDINSETCYDLGKATFAYKGEFENQTHLNIGLLVKVLNDL
ncbi:MAG: biotin/lipoate A/B protein ligase family protein [candidate division WOR-3 bacterium]